MTLNNLYEAANDFNEVDAKVLFHHPYHAQEIAGTVAYARIDWQKVDRVKVYEVWNYDTGDGRRDARIWTAFCDDKPFMCVLAAGRDAQKDHCRVYITNPAVFATALAHIMSCAKLVNESDSLVDADAHLPELDQLYGKEILEEDLGLPTHWGVRQRKERIREMEEAGEEVPAYMYRL